MPDKRKEQVTVDPANIDTPAQLAAALKALCRRRGLSLVMVQRAAEDLRRSDSRAQTLPRSTVSDVLNAKTLPSKDKLLTLLTICSVARPDLPQWLAAWERASTADLAKPPGGVRVRDARPRLLGVHPSIQVDPAATDLPVYVRRDKDSLLRAAIATASEQGGFVLLVGESSVGKTRALFEAVRAMLPEWWLVYPAAGGEAVGALAAAPTPRTVVWLEGLQRYLVAPGGLPAGLARGLVAAGVVLAATMWPDEYSRRRAAPVPGQSDPHANDRELLDLAHFIGLSETFSDAERRRAESLATDERIRIALDTPDAGFTQVLAAGPDLVRRWENAPDPYGKAVITAALDALRIGVQAPLTRDLLAVAAPGYLNSAQQATAPTDWLDQALAYATAPLRGAIAALTPIAAGMGHLAGYTVADYLYQHARRVQRTAHLPVPARRAIVDFLLQRADGDWATGSWMADQIVEEHADIAIDVLRQYANTGDWYPVSKLAGRLTERGRINEAIAVLRDANAGGGAAARAGIVAHRLVDLLAQKGDIEEAIAVIQGHIEAGRIFIAAIRPGELFADKSYTSDVISVLRQRAGAGHEFATEMLADLLAKQSDLDE